MSVRVCYEHCLQKKEGKFQGKKCKNKGNTTTF